MAAILTRYIASWSTFMLGKDKVCIRANWPTRPELILVPVA